MEIIKMVSERFTDLFMKHALSGLYESFKFQKKLIEVTGHHEKCYVSENAICGIGSLYKNIIQSKKDMKKRFLQGILRCFEIWNDLNPK